ncbi:MAG: DUF1349 domain-containing protein [Bryobacteraceae bacterium]
MDDVSHTTAIDVPLCREQLKRILESREFASSERLSEFLNYVSEAAFGGRTELSQYDIATDLFHKDASFDPFEDAYVRKLATQTRQRIERYYSDAGLHDPIVVSLPRRGYLPRFEPNQPPQHDGTHEERLAPADLPIEPVEHTLPRSTNRLVILIVLSVVGASVLAAAYFHWATLDVPDFEIVTQSGDVMHRKLDVKSDGVLLGPRIGVNDEVRVRLTFTPERATQQAGIMIMENPDCYIKLGRHFNSRPQLEFGMEIGGVYHKRPSPFFYDRSGQTGAPIWLSIRRNGDRYLAFVSSDGQQWQRVGDELVQTQPMPAARVAIYGFNGRTDAPSIKASFHDLKVGPTFHDQDVSLLAASANSEWNASSDCATPLAVQLGSFLEVPFASNGYCDWSLLRQAPEGDWEIETQIDFLSMNGTAAGLTVAGDRSKMRLIRWTLNGGSITMEHLGESQASRPDYPGSPLLWLRIRRQGREIFGSFSRDGESFADLPGSISTDRLGPHLRFGVVASRSSWTGSQEVPPALFFGVWQRTKTLSKLY